MTHVYDEIEDKCKFLVVLQSLEITKSKRVPFNQRFGVARESFWKVCKQRKPDRPKPKTAKTIKFQKILKLREFVVVEAARIVNTV